MAAWRFTIGNSGAAHLSSGSRREIERARPGWTLLGYMTTCVGGWFGIVWERPQFRALNQASYMRDRVAVRVEIAGLRLTEGSLLHQFRGWDSVDGARVSFNPAPPELVRVVRKWFAAELTSYTISGLVETEQQGERNAVPSQSGVH